MAWFGEAQWFVLVSLFIAAVVTLAVYLVQYAVRVFWAYRGKSSYSTDRSEANSLLSWILSLNSWKSQWLKAWIRALNEEAGKRGGPIPAMESVSEIRDKIPCGLVSRGNKGSLRLAFEDDDTSRPLELSVKEVDSVVKSESVKVVSCSVVGDSIQFAVRVTRTIPANSGCQVYSVLVTPLHLNLELRVKEENGGNLRVSWSMGDFSGLNLQVQPKAKQEGPGASAVLETLEDILKNLMGNVQPSVELTTRPSEVRDFQNVVGVGGASQVICPPKPPRAHELKLQVKNIKASFYDGTCPSGPDRVMCSLQLNHPVQKVTTAAVNNTTSPSWDEDFSLELSAKSRELQLQIRDAEKPAESPPIAWASVPLDLFRKQPSGYENFLLSSRSGAGQSGSVTAQFLYVEPIEAKWPIQAPVSSKKVEKDRTVLPCGTVVTTVTSVTSKPRVEGKGSAVNQDSPAKMSPKVTEQDLAIQALPSQSAGVSKALSSSDTELLMLNGSDPVAEVAIRQLRESSRQSLKSPRKKSTIIISGISKTAVTQDDETTLMLNYAATMDSTTGNSPDSSALNTTPEESDAPPPSQESAPIQGDLSPQEELCDAWENGSHQEEEWTGNGAVEPDCEEMSVSNLSISETGSVKKSKGGFFQKGAKLFFRRRHQQKDPGMSQSHNDLVYLQQPGSEQHARKGATLSRLLMGTKNKSKGKGPDHTPRATAK